MDEVDDGLADEALGVVEAHEVVAGRVDVADDAALVDHDGIGDEVDEQPVAVGQLAQRRLRQAALGHVGHDASDRQGAVGLDDRPGPHHEGGVVAVAVGDDPVALVAAPGLQRIGGVEEGPQEPAPHVELVRGGEELERVAGVI